MEFERNTPTTAQDIALADAPKVTLQPPHDLDIPPVINDRSHQREGSFAFETESTTPAALEAATLNSHSHHKVALAVSGIVVSICVVAVATLYLLR